MYSEACGHLGRLQGHPGDGGSTNGSLEITHLLFKQEERNLCSARKALCVCVCVCVHTHSDDTEEKESRKPSYAIANRSVLIA